jgi:predicted ATPase
VRRMSESIQVTVEEIRLQNFRAFENARLQLSDLTFLVGRNGAGKSSLLDAVDLLRQATSESLENALDGRGGLTKVQRLRAAPGPNSPMGIAIVFSIALLGDRRIRVLYGFEVQGDPKGGTHVRERLQSEGQVYFDRQDETFTSTLSDRVSPPVGNLVLPLVARTDTLWAAVLDAVRNLRAYELSPAHMAAAPKIGEATYLARDGANAGDVLKAVQSTPAHRWVLDRIKLVADGLVDVRADALMGRRVLHFVQSQGANQIELDASQVSQGTLRSLGILLALRQVQIPSLVLLDEIENSIHPGALSLILEAALASTDGARVVLTTHSPEVLSHPSVVAERVRLIEWRDGTSQIFRLSAETEAAVNSIDTVGWMLRSNALWPAPAPELFVGDVLDLGQTLE